MPRGLAVLLLLICLALAGCAKPATSAGPATAAQPATAPPATAPPAAASASSSAAVAIAPPAADAALASAGGLKVLVPGSVDDASSAAGGDPLDALVRAIDKEVTAAARSKKPAERIVIYADTTIDYGCLCPPFVFAPLYNSGRPEAYVLPVFAKGVPEPPLTKLGWFRFAGHFDGRRITGLEWLEQRGVKAEEGMSEYEHRAPVFIVDGWCFEPADSSPELFTDERYGSTLKGMAQEGRFCPAAR